VSSTPEDVAIRLSPKGLEDISAAFKKILGDINRTGKEGQKALGPLRQIGADLNRLIPTIGFVAAIRGLTQFTRSVLEGADAAGKSAAKFGTTSETITTLQFAAKGANVENGQLETGFVQLTKSLGELNAGTKNQTDAFARLGLSAQDFNGRDVGQSFALVAEKMAAIPNSAVKTRTALDIFGKQAVDLIPLLNDLGTQGFDEVRKQAERFGLVVDSETAAAAAAVNDSFTLIGAQTRGLATQFISGLGPVVATIMEDFRNDVAGKGVTAAADFGKQTGAFLRDVIFAFQFTGRAIGLFFANLVDRIKTFGSNYVAAWKLDFDTIAKNNAELADRMLGRQTEFEADIDGLRAQRVASEQRAAQLVEDAQKKATDRSKMLRDLELLEQQQATAEKRKAADEKAAKEAEKLAKERAEKEKDAIQAIFELEQSLGEARGQGREVQIAKLEQELAQQRKILEAAGMLNAETEDLLNQVKNFGTLNIDFGNLGDQIKREFDAFKQAREQIESDVQAGVATTLDGERRLLELEQSRLPVLREMVEELKKQALLLGSPEAIAEAERMSLAIDQMALSVKNATQPLVQIREAGLDAFESGISDVLTSLEEFESVEDVFKSLARTVGQALQQILADMLAAYLRAVVLKALLSAFSSSAAPASSGNAGSLTQAGGVLVAGGGYIRGPGTSTSDSIPAWLSDGEYVVRAKAVSQPGALEFLQYLNRNVKMPTRSSPRYAEGGMVGAAPPAQSGGRNIRIMNVIDPSMLIDALGTPEGEEMVLNIIDRNGNRVRRGR
jgi:hypothetical protein